MKKKQAIATQAQSVALPNNDLLFTHMFALYELKNNLQTAITRILVLEKELVESKSREKILQIFCEKHTKKYIPSQYHIDVKHTLV
jgi:hypothetical protein